MPKDFLHSPLRFARLGILLALPAFGVVAAFGTAQDGELLLPGTATVEPLSIDVEATLVPAPASFVREDRFLRGDTPAGLLSRLGVNSDDIQSLLRSRTAPLRSLRAGMSVTAEVSAEGALLSLSYVSGKDSIVTLTREGEGFASTESRARFEAHTTLRSGTIRSSLFAAADAAGLPDSVAIQMAEIFGGDIDFHRDLRKNDRFSVVYEMLYLDGRAARAGRVLAAEFVNAGKSFRAVWHAGADGKGGYYAPDGKNLRKAFLRSPLEFSRVSSGFGLRMHPIMQQWRAHRGVDYAAPTGTRVRAVSDGTVDFAARQGGYGNMVVIKHQGQFSTAYAHLSAFAPGLRKGARVSQGDVIGFVGQTGWATGPHLHYEFRVAGEPRNPLAVVLPAAEPLGAQELAAFRALAAPLAAQLDLLATTNLAALE